MVSTATTNRPDIHSRTGTGPVRPLHRPADVARLLGCSEWWVKEQARQRRIPYAWIGGSYRFTDEHITEIVRRYEVAPLTDTPTEPSTSPVPRRRQPPVEPTLSPQLIARPPRRPRPPADPDHQVS